MTEEGPGAVYAEPSEPGGSGRRWLVPVAVFVVLLGMLVAVVVVAQQSGDDGAPPEPDAFVAPVPRVETQAFDVQQRSDSGVVTMAAADGATVDVNLDAIRVELLTQIEMGDVAVGDRVSVIGRENEVRNFVVTSVVVFEEGAGLEESDAGYRSAGGFQGWEAERDQALRPVLAGTVIEASDTEMTLETPAGEVTVSLVESETAGRPPIFRIEEGGTRGIDSGDRIALIGMGEDGPEGADAALVRPASN